MAAGGRQSNILPWASYSLNPGLCCPLVFFFIPTFQPQLPVSIPKAVPQHVFIFVHMVHHIPILMTFNLSISLHQALMFLVDISSWIVAHQLKLNSSKTEQLQFPRDTSPHEDLMICLPGELSNLTIRQQIQLSGLSFSSHFANLTWSCRIQKDPEATQVFVNSFAILRPSWMIASCSWQIFH